MFCPRKLQHTGTRKKTICNWVIPSFCLLIQLYSLFKERVCSLDSFFLFFSYLLPNFIGVLMAADVLNSFNFFIFQCLLFLGPEQLKNPYYLALSLRLIKHLACQQPNLYKFSFLRNSFIRSLSVVWNRRASGYVYAKKKLCRTNKS